MQTTLDYRRENLRKLIEQWNGPLPLAKKLGYKTASFLVQMAGPNPSREVSEKTARDVEEKLALPTMWLDQEHAKHNSKKAVGAAAHIRPSAPKHHETKVSDNTVDVGVISQVIRVVGQAAEDAHVHFSPEKLANVVLMVYDDVQITGEVRVQYVQQLLQLLK